jgi:hypothetical protein
VLRWPAQGAQIWGGTAPPAALNHHGTPAAKQQPLATMVTWMCRTAAKSRLTIASHRGTAPLAEPSRATSTRVGEAAAPGPRLPPRPATANHGGAASPSRSPRCCLLLPASPWEVEVAQCPKEMTPTHAGPGRLRR